MDIRQLAINPVSLSPATEVKQVIVSPSVELKGLPASPLTPRLKQLLVEELKKVDLARLKPVLVDAALNMHSFPTSINQKLANLQLVYREQQGNQLVAPFLRQAIVAYVESELLAQFCEYLTKTFKEEEWNSSSLMFLCGQLKIRIEEEPLVEAEIRDGKTYWRIMQGATVLYDRQYGKGTTFNFTSLAWKMPWHLFRTFKDSGKRSSSVAITRDLFVARFVPHEKYTAALIWQELKDIGVLNARNRLSHGWRALSNVYVELKSLPNTWNYEKVLDEIYGITDLKHSATEEKIPGIPEAKIYRSERARQRWSSRGLVKHRSPTSDAYRMNMWDVAIASDANAHRTSEKTSLGDKITYDHIPAGGILRAKFKETPIFLALQQN